MRVSFFLIVERNITWRWSLGDTGKTSLHPPLNRLVSVFRFKKKTKQNWQITTVNHSYMSSQEKEAALNMTVNTFCTLAKQHANIDQLVTM